MKQISEWGTLALALAHCGGGGGGGGGYREGMFALHYTSLTSTTEAV